jgi:tetratricopeptide (TPR) repeat protein
MTGIARGFGWAALLLIVVTQGCPRAEAGPEGTTLSVPADTDSHQRARALFDQGQAHYALGEYDDAIACFREAYQVSSAPMLLFNIAQAHRLKGDCTQAVEVYRHFVRLAPDAPLAGEARRHIGNLEAQCPRQPQEATATPAGTGPAGPPSAPPTAPSPPPRQPPSPPPVDTTGPGAAAAAQSSRGRTRLTRVLLIGGLGLAAGAGVMALWNDSRYHDWNSEDAELRRRAAPAEPIPDSWVARQDKNDALLRSIWRVDVATGVMAGLSAASIITSAIVSQWPQQSAHVSLHQNGVHVAWQVRWP